MEYYQQSNIFFYQFDTENKTFMCAFNNMPTSRQLLFQSSMYDMAYEKITTNPITQPSTEAEFNAKVLEVKNTF
jgi:hypothetical protein